MSSRFTRGLALLALVTLAPVIARADAVSDQKKAYESMGIKINKGAKMCNLVTQSEAERYLGKPVHPCEDAGIATGCSYRAADGSNDGILVLRTERSTWSLPGKEYAATYRPVSGVGEKAYTYNEPLLGNAANVLSAKGVTEVQMSGKASADAALALARLAMNR